MSELRVVRQLRVNLTNDEIRERGKIAAKLVGEIGTLQDEKKQSAKHYVAEIDSRQTQVKHLSYTIDSGFEERDVTCLVMLDSPQVGLKTTVRLDTGEEVETEAMTDSDRQRTLPLTPAKEVVN